MLKPSADSDSWLTHECWVFGTLPFMYTCSSRINVIVMRCNFDNAFVQPSAIRSRYPGPQTSESSTNEDINFYYCTDSFESDPNPYSAANTFAHEMAHVIQAGFGSNFNALTE